MITFIYLVICFLSEGIWLNMELIPWLIGLDIAIVIGEVAVKLYKIKKIEC